MDTAKIFQSGNSQAIRLPKAYRLPGKKVYLKRVGNAIMVIPEKNGWEPLINSLGKFSSDFMEDRGQPEQQERPELDQLFE
jgi:antitoxin VapB